MAEGDIPEGVQGFIDAANAAQVTGDHASRAAHATAALKAWGDDVTADRDIAAVDRHAATCRRTRSAASSGSRST